MCRKWAIRSQTSYKHTVASFIMDESKYGEIYRVTCTATNMSYIGQARCRVGKNNKRHGANGRWLRHVSKALHSSQPFAETTLWAAIKKYGAHSFKVEVVERCIIPELDMREAHFIAHFCTLIPKGYNKLDATYRVFQNKQWTEEQRTMISTMRKHDIAELPMYIVHIKARPEKYAGEGYAVINHPLSRAKYFTSKSKTMEEKLTMAKEYLQTLK